MKEKKKQPLFNSPLSKGGNTRGVEKLFERTGLGQRLQSKHKIGEPD